MAIKPDAKEGSGMTTKKRAYRVYENSQDCFSFHISGIPCLIETTGNKDFEVYDRKGYRAKWLEKKLVQSEIDEIFERTDEMAKENNY